MSQEKLFILLMMHKTYSEIIGVYRSSERVQQAKSDFIRRKLTGCGPTTALFILEREIG